MRVDLVLLAAILLAVPTTQDWDEANRNTRRLLPSAFTELPASIQKELTRRGCTVPQPYSATRPENVISGRFTSPMRKDWAILCSIRRASSILVFRGGSPSVVVELAREPDRDRLQGIGGGAIGYSRAIGVASPDVIRTHYERYRGPKPPPLDHDGIDDAFIEKASVVWYWRRGRWLELTGSN